MITLRVWPSDLDQNRHLTNGRYLSMMDLGRFDLVQRTGLMRLLFEHKWYPVVSAATIRFRKPLDAFQSYQLRTRIVGWDAQGFYLEQSFEREGRVHAIGVIKGVFLGSEGKVSTARIIDLMAPGTLSPRLPEWIATWERCQGELSAALKGA